LKIIHHLYKKFHIENIFGKYISYGNRKNSPMMIDRNLNDKAKRRRRGVFFLSELGSNFA